MSKIKSVSQFEDGIWGTETPIGADASNVDVEMSDSSTKDLQTVLGDIPSAAAPIQSQINTKVTASGGNIGNTTVSSGIQNFDSSSSETSTELLDTSVRVTNATEVTSSMWTKFNRFRKRVDNKFKDVFLSSVEDVASPSDYKTYSQSALNDYFAHVVGYASASDLPDATSTIAQQLSTLNNKLIIDTGKTGIWTWEKFYNGLILCHGTASKWFAFGGLWSNAHYAENAAATENLPTSLFASILLAQCTFNTYGIFGWCTATTSVVTYHGTANAESITGTYSIPTLIIGK